MPCTTYSWPHPLQTQEQSDVLAVAAYIVGSAPQPSLPQQQPDKDKKLRNLKKVCVRVCMCACVWCHYHSIMCWSLVQKLKQIEDLKQRQVEGQVLEQNQVSLLACESSCVSDVPS